MNIKDIAPPPTVLTQEYIEYLFAYWAKRLYLTQWTFQFKWDTPPEPGDEAQVDAVFSYDYANIRINPLFHEWNFEYANKVVIHELYHLLFRDLDCSADVAENFLDEKLWEMFILRYEHEVEAVVDRLATITYELSGGS